MTCTGDCALGEQRKITHCTFFYENDFIRTSSHEFGLKISKNLEYLIGKKEVGRVAENCLLPWSARKNIPPYLDKLSKYDKMLS